jgi:hypothetical protein
VIRKLKEDLLENLPPLLSEFDENTIIQLETHLMRKSILSRLPANLQPEVEEISP